MEEPLMVEVIAYAPTAYYHCTHCEVAWREIGVTNHVHDEQVESSLPADMLQDYQAVSDWVRQLFNRYCDQVVVKVIDAASLEGFWKSMRNRVHRYPAIIVAGQVYSARGALEAASDAINRLLPEGQTAA